MKPKRKKTWLKNRGYLHITRQINVYDERGAVLGMVKNPDFVAGYNFFPLIHTNIKVRRYKIPKGGSKRQHSFEGKTHAKLRPLHYASHMDAMIFGYYGDLLQKAYLKEIENTPHLSDCVTAYRRIKDPSKKDAHKSTIHFAHEVFTAIKERAENGGCWALKFDIESFFSSIDHSLLKKAWAKITRQTMLSPDHYNVFKASTRFSYILRDDLRARPTHDGHRSGFDEGSLAEIRKQNTSSFFADPADFRQVLKEGKLKVYKNQFRNKAGDMMGIPQGLPLSATLANLYLLEFDKAVLNFVVTGRQGYYRRYSDDIIIICKEDQRVAMIDFLSHTLENGSKVTISPEKTEQYYFTSETIGHETVVRSHLLKDCSLYPDRPLTYLGFEYYGYKTLIKSANLSKFYRRMIMAVKGKARHAMLSARNTPGASQALFRRRLYRLYTNINLDEKEVKRKHKYLEPNRFGYYVYRTEQKDDEFRSNYFSYATRASDIMKEPRIIKQVRRHRTIFTAASKKQLAIYKRKYLD
jgi:hypothetical protein